MRKYWDSPELMQDWHEEQDDRGSSWTEVSLVSSPCCLQLFFNLSLVHTYLYRSKANLCVLGCCLGQSHGLSSPPAPSSLFLTCMFLFILAYTHGYISLWDNAAYNLSVPCCLQLFFDLFLVAAVSAVVHIFVADPTWRGAGRYLLYFGLFHFIWTSNTCV